MLIFTDLCSASNSGPSRLTQTGPVMIKSWRNGSLAVWLSPLSRPFSTHVSCLKLSDEVLSSLLITLATRLYWIEIKRKNNRPTTSSIHVITHNFRVCLVSRILSYSPWSGILWAPELVWGPWRHWDHSLWTASLGSAWHGHPVSGCKRFPLDARWHRLGLMSIAGHRGLVSNILFLFSSLATPASSSLASPWPLASKNKQ